MIHASTDALRERAQALLERSVGPDAESRPDQLEAIERVGDVGGANGRRRGCTRRRRDCS